MKGGLFVLAIGLVMVIAGKLVSFGERTGERIKGGRRDDPWAQVVRVIPKALYVVGIPLAALGVFVVLMGAF